MKTAPETRFKVALVVMTLVVAACGNGEGESTTSTDTSPTATTNTSETTTAKVGEGEAPDPSGEYMVTHYANPSNAVTNLWPDSEITLVLGSNGTISGNAGCNDYTGTYEVSGPYVEEPGFDERKGQALTVTDLSWTEMACEDDLVMEQETEYLDALQNVDLWLFGQGFSDDPNALLFYAEGEGLQVSASKSE